MKSHTSYSILCALLVSVLVISCGKKTESDADKMAMAKPDSIGGGGPAPVTTVTIANSSKTGATNSGTPGISISNSANSTKGTVTCTNSVSSTYQYMAYYGGSTDATSSTPSSGAVSSWPAGTFSPLPQYFYPMFKGSGTNAPTSWTAYSTVNVTAATGSTTWATGSSTDYPNANIKIEIQGGGGEPGK
ncbi:MAG: hypothetical protein ABI778_04675 [Ignavibacteriota bacterium]